MRSCGIGGIVIRCGVGDGSISANHVSHEAIGLLRWLNDAVRPMDIGMLCGCSGGTASRATVLRRLDELLASGLIERLGRARATRYVITERGRTVADESEGTRRSAPGWHWGGEALGTWGGAPGEVWGQDFTLKDEEDKNLPFSLEAERVRTLIRRPLRERTACGYRAEFLEGYEPNVTWYLPADVRERLRRMGQTDAMSGLPAGTYVRKVLDRLLIDLSWNSSRLEGNTFSLLETERLLQAGRDGDPTRVLEARMILNHKEAIEFLVEAHEETGLNRYTIMNLHDLLSNGLLRDPSMEGRLRSRAVGIGGSKYVPLDVPQLIEQHFVELLDKAARIEDALEQSFFLMVHLPYLQPFEDVNKRVSRLAANIPLIRENMAPLSFTGVPVSDYVDAMLAVYELNRVDLLRELFVRAYEDSAGRYSAVVSSLAAPDPVGVRYHEELRSVVREVVQGRLDKTAAALHVRHWARDGIAPADRPRAIELAEEQLLGLHEHKTARYRLRPSEFAAWQEVWTRR